MGYLINSAIFGSKKAKQIENNKQHKDNLKLKEERNKLKQEELKIKKAELEEKQKERELKAKIKAEELEAKKALKLEKSKTNQSELETKSNSSLAKNSSNLKPETNENIVLENFDKLFIPILKYVISSRNFTINDIKEEFQLGTNRANRILEDFSKNYLVYTIDNIEFHSRYEPTDELDEIINRIKNNGN